MLFRSPTFVLDGAGGGNTYSLTNNGVITVGTGTLTMTVDGTFTNNGTFTQTAGTLTATTGLVNSATGTVNASGGALNGTGVLSLAGGVINGGALRDSGTLRLTAGSTHAMGGAGFSLDGGRVLRNEGTLVADFGPSVNATINLNDSGSFTQQTEIGRAHV